MDFEVYCQSNILQYRPCAAVFFNKHDIPGTKPHHFLRKVTSFCTGTLHKGLQHLFELNVKLCSKRPTSVQSSLEKPKEIMEREQQHYDRMTSFLSNHFNRFWYSWKKVLVQVCAEPPSQGSEPFDWKPCNNTKKRFYEVGPCGVCSLAHGA